MTAVFLVLYVCAIIAVSLYLLTLATRFVKAHERMAAALERTASAPRRD